MMTPHALFAQDVAESWDKDHRVIRAGACELVIRRNLLRPHFFLELKQQNPIIDDESWPKKGSNDPNKAEGHHDKEDPKAVTRASVAKGSRDGFDVFGIQHEEWAALVARAVHARVAEPDRVTEPDRAAAEETEQQGVNNETGVGSLRIRLGRLMSQMSSSQSLGETHHQDPNERYHEIDQFIDAQMRDGHEYGFGIVNALNIHLRAVLGWDKPKNLFFERYASLSCVSLLLRPSRLASRGVVGRKSGSHPRAYCTGGRSLMMTVRVRAIHVRAIAQVRR